METSTSAPQRLYLMQVATMIRGPLRLPDPCYLIQTGDGKNILIDSGFSPNFRLVPNSPTTAPGLKRVEQKSVVEQLTTIGVKPSDINIVIITHFDEDHAGNLAAFPNAQLIAQRRQYEVARAGDPRFASTRSQWDRPLSRYQLVDGDTQLLPGLKLIETSGHCLGHQSVLVHLPQTGLVLLTADAVTVQAHFTPHQPVGPTDADGAGAIASTCKLLALVEREHVSLVIFGHDEAQWATLKCLPDFYD